MRASRFTPRPSRPGMGDSGNFRRSPAKCQSLPVSSTPTRQVLPTERAKGAAASWRSPKALLWSADVPAEIKEYIAIQASLTDDFRLTRDLMPAGLVGLPRCEFRTFTDFGRFTAAFLDEQWMHVRDPIRAMSSMVGTRT